jgi:hypothetical protein
LFQFGENKRRLLAIFVGVATYTTEHSLWFLLDHIYHKDYIYLNFSGTKRPSDEQVPSEIAVTASTFIYPNLLGVEAKELSEAAKRELPRTQIGSDRPLLKRTTIEIMTAF